MRNTFFSQFRINLSVIILSIFFSTVFKSEAAIINVNSIQALQTAIDNSSPGDIICLANGHYADNSFDLSKNNITIKAVTPGGVFMDGYNSIYLSGNNSTISGFQFTANYTQTGNVFDVYGDGNTITEMNFNGYSSDKFIQISGKDNVISHCNFQNKLCVLTNSKGGTGDMVQILPNASYVGNNIIRYCSFQHMPGLGGDFGNECIRIGNSSYSTMISRTVVEYCYFEDTGLGDSEAISVKSRENILRYNTMNNNKDAMFVFRNGDNNVAYGNFFINSGGIRVKEANNIFCYNNYFEKSGVGGSMEAVTYIYDTTTSTHVLDNINFLHNTFVDCGNINFGGIGATNGAWANNIFKKAGTIFTYPNAGTSYKGNIYTGTLGINIPSGMTQADPLLVMNSDGYYDLSSASPAIGAASDVYPALLNIPGVDTLLLDMKGLSRPMSRLLKDVGCEQFNAQGTITNRPLKLSDVGPTYLKPLTIIETPKENLNFNIQVNSATKKLVLNYTLAQNSTINLAIYNLNGTLIKSIDIKNTENQQQILDISSLQNGMYLVRFSEDNLSKTVKFILGN
ncbi:MAG: chondroitinase-B domain-containing protein [Paludibacter sp.]